MVKGVSGGWMGEGWEVVRGLSFDLLNVEVSISFSLHWKKINQNMFSY